MNLTKLQTFLTLSECLSFTEAAELLYCSQPAVSMQIQGLEHDIGSPLFDRIGKKLYLTKQGELFKPYAEQIVNLLQSARDHLQQLDDLTHGTLSFGASNFVGVYLLPALLGEFNQAYPGIRINMNITSSRQLIDMLESNKAEFLVISDQIPLDDARLQAATFYKDELVLIAKTDHAFAESGACAIEDLRGETMLWKPKKSATRAYLEGKFAEYGISFRSDMEISNLEAIKQGVIHGLGLSIVSKFAVAQEIRSGLLASIPIQGVKLERGIRYVYFKNKLLSPASKQFIQMLERGRMFDRQAAAGCMTAVAKTDEPHAG
ncbi:LysR family transcriptional regulator [Paenibacillus doosanensis]|uniref:HTH-type transcriptional activator CmpR n=1 Tax=Paenibacillus konkukensis TaxID=2020716 RepID=A0ABY4RI06_9BACL|nr:MULTISPECIES: LysR family transcriptional regulator [Paenibacillus]MCS7459815.1 LysR family transcriptional regulator [Paenibacillus doosanensis]UQZ81765.1 HTH-type transcriptional activator CmpR [Paenibacillus konkukensis]